MIDNVYLDLSKSQLLIKEKSLNLKNNEKKKCEREGRRGVKEGGRRGKGKERGFLPSLLSFFLSSIFFFSPFLQTWTNLLLFLSITEAWASEIYILFYIKIGQSKLGLFFNRFFRSLIRALYNLRSVRRKSFK